MREQGLRARGANKKTDCTSDSETQGRLRKKPKIESRSNSDCDSDASDFEDGQAVNGLLTNNGFASPFPSPDHNYAISPVKIDASEIKDETEESVKEEVKEEPQDDETPNSRYKVLVIRLFWAQLTFLVFSYVSRRSVVTMSWMRNTSSSVKKSC